MKKLLFLFAVLLTSVGAWAQTKQYLQDVEVSASNGTGVEALKWSKTWTSNNSLLTLSVGANNMTLEDGVLALYRGSSANATYTLSVPDNHRIISYSFDYVLTGNETGTLKLKVGETEYTPSDQTQNISVNDINAQTTTFQLLAVNNGIKVTNFTVRVESAVAFSYVYKKDESIIKEDMYHLYKDTEYPAVPYSYVTPTGTPTGKVSYEDEGKSYEITVEYSLPFAVSESYQNAKWYYLNIRNNNKKWVAYSSSVPYQNSKQIFADDANKWAFVGNPLAGIQILNKASGDGYTLGCGGVNTNDNVYMKEGETTWTIEEVTDGFAFRQGVNQYIHDMESRLQMWNHTSAKVDAGSAFNIVEIPTNAFYQSWGNHYPWSNAEVEDVDVPNGLQVCGYDRGAQGHVLRKAETKINATGADISVTFTYMSGNHMLMIAGVDLVKDDRIVKYDYHEGKSGGEILKNKYTLKDVQAGEYILRYFVCQKTTGDNQHDLTKTNGQIYVEGASRMPIDFVYNYTIDGETKSTELFEDFEYGARFPVIKNDFPYGVVFPETPNGCINDAIIIDGVATKEIELQHNLPFERSANATDNAKWYIVDMHSNDNGEANIYNGVEKYLWTYIPDAGTANVQLPMELSKQTELFDDDKLWCFVGNVYDGFKIYNKLAGESVTLNKKADGNTEAYMSDATEATSYLVSTSDAISGALCFQPKGHGYYLNTNGSGSVGKLLKGWNDKSGGSSCRMFAPTDFVKETIMAEYDGNIPACAVGTKKELTRDAYALLSSTMTSLEENGWNTDLVTEEVSAVLTRLMGSDERIQLKEGYYLIKGTGTGNNASWYATYSGNNNGEFHALPETPGVKHIWFFDKVEDKEGYKFMACNTGKYVKLVAAPPASTVTSDYNDGFMFTFTENDGHKYTIKDGNGSVMRTENDGRINYWGSERNETWYLISATDMEIPVAISNAGAATLYSSVPLSIPEDVTAKYLKVAGNENSQGTLHYTTLKNTIPANTPVVLIGGEKQHTFKVAEDVAAVEGNILFGYSFDTAVEGSGYEATGQDGTIYALANKTNGLGFYHFNDNTYKAGKAYLDVSGLATSGVRFFNIFDEDNETGVEVIEIVNDNQKSEIYDLSGRRVQTAKKGLYIVNGKKVIR